MERRPWRPLHQATAGRWSGGCWSPSCSGRATGLSKSLQLEDPVAGQLGAGISKGERQVERNRPKPPRRRLLYNHLHAQVPDERAGAPSPHPPGLPGCLLPPPRLAGHSWSSPSFQSSHYCHQLDLVLLRKILSDTFPRLLQGQVFLLICCLKVL